MHSRVPSLPQFHEDFVISKKDPPRPVSPQNANSPHGPEVFDFVPTLNFDSKANHQDLSSVFNEFQKIEEAESDTEAPDLMFDMDQNLEPPSPRATSNLEKLSPRLDSPLATSVHSFFDAPTSNSRSFNPRERAESFDQPSLPGDGDNYQDLVESDSERFGPSAPSSAEPSPRNPHSLHPITHDDDDDIDDTLSEFLPAEPPTVRFEGTMNGFSLPLEQMTGTIPRVPDTFRKRFSIPAFGPDDSPSEHIQLPEEFLHSPHKVVIIGPDENSVEELADVMPVPALCVYGNDMTVRLMDHLTYLISSDESLLVVSMIHCPDSLEGLKQFETELFICFVLTEDAVCNGTHRQYDTWREKVPNVVFGVGEMRFLQALGGDGVSFPWPNGFITSNSLKTFLEADRDLLVSSEIPEFLLFADPLYGDFHEREESVSSDLTLPDEQIAQSQTPLLEWSCEDVARFIRSTDPLVDDEVVGSFQARFIDGRKLIMLGKDDLKDLVRALGVRKTIRKAIQNLKESELPSVKFESWETSSVAIWISLIDDGTLKYAVDNIINNGMDGAFIKSIYPDNLKDVIRPLGHRNILKNHLDGMFSVKKKTLVKTRSTSSSVGSKSDAPISRKEIDSMFKKMRDTEMSIAYGQKALNQFRPEVGFDEARQKFLNNSKTKKFIEEGENHAKRVRQTALTPSSKYDVLIQQQAERIRELQKQVDAIDNSRVSGLQKNELALGQVLSREIQSLQEKEERELIMEDERLREFYITFQIMFGDTLMACRVIHSGMVEKYNYGFLESTHRSVLTLGNGIPGVALISALIFGGLKTVPEYKQQDGINLAAGMFTSQEVADKTIETMARMLSFGLARHIKALSTKKIDTYNALSNAMWRTDLDNEIKVFASTKVGEFFQYVFDGRVGRGVGPAQAQALCGLLLGDDWRWVSPIQASKVKNLGINFDSKNINFGDEKKNESHALVSRAEMEFLEREVKDLRKQLVLNEPSSKAPEVGKHSNRQIHMKAPSREKLESFKAAVENRLRPTFGARNKDIEEPPQKEKKEKKRFWSKKKKKEKVEVEYTDKKAKQQKEEEEDEDDDHIPILYPGGKKFGSSGGGVSKDFEVQTKEKLAEMQQVVMEQQRLLSEQQKEHKQHKKLTESALKKIEKKMADVPYEVKGGNSCQAMVGRAEYFKNQHQNNAGGIYGNQKQVLQQEQRMDDLQEKVLELESVVKTQSSRIQSLEKNEAKANRTNKPSKGCCTIS